MGVKTNILIALATIMMVVSANYEQSSGSNSKVFATETWELYGDLLEIMESNDDYARVSGNSGMSGMNQHSNQMLGSMSSQSRYGTGSVQSNTQQSSRVLNGGSASNYGMHSSGSASNYGMQNQRGSGSNGFHNHGS